MKPSVRIAIVLLVVLLVPLAAFAAPSGKVDLPLKDYLALVETAERAEKQKAEEQARREMPVAEVVSQRIAVTVGASEAAIVSDFEVLLQGKALRPVLLPLAGFPETIEIRDESGKAGAAAVAAAEGGVMLTAPQPGRYTVHVTGRAGLETGGGTGRIDLGTVAAPVASTEIDLPADRSWESPGTVVVEETAQNGRRHVRLATARGVDTVLDVRRKVDSAEAEKLLAESVVLTILQLRPEGVRRHDVVLYQVQRGGLSRFTVDLPPGLEVDQAATDEGPVVPVVESGRLTLHREHRLQGVGYLVLSAPPTSLDALTAGGLSLDTVKPEPAVRARYVAVSQAVAADVRPQPAASWTRVDTTDLPAMLSDALSALDLAAAWRLAVPSESAAGARLAVAPLPAAPILGATVRRRDTTALLTVDGTLLYRDHFIVDSRSRSGAALDVALPAGGKLWSAKVDDQPVRPLERGGLVSVPLGFTGGMRAEVEIVSVLEKALPPGRSQLALDLPQVTVPVLLHRLRLLLPDNASYRIRGGDLRFAPFQPSAPAAAAAKPAAPGSRDPWQLLQTAPGVLTDRINVGGNESGQQSAFAGPGTLFGGYANLYATLTDKQGNALPGATLTLTRKDHEAVMVSDAKGQARFNGLADGAYTLTAELEGFATLTYPNIALTNGRNTVLEIALEPASVDGVTVTAEAPLLDERRISTGATVSQEEVEKVPTSKTLLQDLQQGLVGGVKPLPVAIPETGKAFAFSGVLPPPHIRLELEARGGRPRY
jgi:hypothetical protein